MSAIRPSQAQWNDGARLLGESARLRAAAAIDLFLAEELRLTEAQRLTARALLGRLLRAIEDELRAAVADRFVNNRALHAALASAHVELAAAALDGAALSDEPGLIGLLLRRVEEHRLHLAGRGREQRLAALVADRDPEIAAHAMAVLVARSRRLDRFQEPVLARTELPAELQHALVWTVAAALRAYLTGPHQVSPALADAALGEAAAAAIAGYDEGDSLEGRAMRLCRRLHVAGRLDGATIAGFLGEGVLPLFIAGLSAATTISYGAVWDILTDPAGKGPVLLLKVAGLDREQAGRSLLALAAHADDDRLIRQVDLFDVIGRDDAERALSLWLLDPAYRAALLRLAS